MLKVNSKHFRLFCLFTALFAAITTGHANTESPTIDQARAALEQAKNALETAQNSIREAETKKDTSTTTPSPKSKQANPEKLYKWVDENGNISYQNFPPPKEANVLDSDVLGDLTSDQKSVSELRRSTDPEPANDSSRPVMVYTADNCKPCQSVVLYLTQEQVPFIERDIRDDRRARDRLAKLSKQIMVPTLFIGSQIVQGNSNPQIKAALINAGYLK